MAWRLVSEPLASDMAAFKAANPGAVLQDFLAWHSPKDVPQARPQAAATGAAPEQDAGALPEVALSGRMAAAAVPAPTSLASSAAACAEAARGGGGGGGGADSSESAGSLNPWHVLWDSTPACPAAEQKPLQVRFGMSMNACMPECCPEAPGLSMRACMALASRRRRVLRCALRRKMCATHYPVPQMVHASAAHVLHPVPQDPSLEAERVLHELETLPPAALFDALLALALAGAAHTLAATDGARALPPMAGVVERFYT